MVCAIAYVGTENLTTFKKCLDKTIKTVQNGQNGTMTINIVIGTVFAKVSYFSLFWKIITWLQIKVNSISYKWCSKIKQIRGPF